MFRSRSWFGGGLWKPKNPHSLEHLKYLYNVLSKNQVVSENNRSLLVETLRSIAEILIWGDQNDSSVFDFFLEKNMLSFFLKIMKQKCGSYVCVQLLQTLNILFENIRDETSLYYLLSNNHVNSIIVHKFDFSDEEVMAYYISFLKTLSLKLNAHTVHFFYNEHTNDFPLYTEAIKFFNHPESMVRIAVRTLTLNVYRVEDKSMLQFIRDKTAAPYFSNLVWFIKNHVLELDACVRNDDDHQSQNRLADLVAEHLDHLHYLNDILCLDICDLNQVLTDHLLNKLLIPVYIFSLSKKKSEMYLQDSKGYVSGVVSLFLLSQVFLIINHSSLVKILTWIILYGDTETPILTSPEKWLAQLQFKKESQGAAAQDGLQNSELDHCSSYPLAEQGASRNFDSDINITDEEKEKLLGLDASGSKPVPPTKTTCPFLEVIIDGLQCTENDYRALFALCLLYAIGHNDGINKEMLDSILFPTERKEVNNCYSSNVVEKIVRIIIQSCQPDSKIRLVTLELGLKLLTQLIFVNDSHTLSDSQLAAIAGAKEESTSVVRNFYKTEEIFLDMFEDEYNEMKKKPLNVEFLMMDSNILLPPTGTPMTGIEFNKRLPCGEVERTRRAIRVFFLIRELCLSLGIEQENQVLLPLTNPLACVQMDECLDLNNADLIACTLFIKEGGKMRRFLVIGATQLILVEPDTKKLGWGVAKFVGFLQDIEVTDDKDDTRCLHITVHRPLSSTSVNRVPLLSAKFIFDDYIRCLAARQRLMKGRMKARQKKMQQIAKLLDLPSSMSCRSPPSYTSLRSRDGSTSRSSREHRSLFLSHQKVPGVAAALRREVTPGGSSTSVEVRDRIVTRASACSMGSESKVFQRARDESGSRVSSRSGSRTRDHSITSSRSGSRQRDASGSPRRSNGSPKMPRPRSEEIPLEDMRLKQKRENILLSNATNGKFQAPPISPPINNFPQPAVVVPIEVPIVIKANKEETSFTEENGEETNVNAESTPDPPPEPHPELNEPPKPQRRRGQVETV
ncbi:UNVERIFIED_CONTAM: hypothetical protein PYX00_000494 [Menopon gallinae]|uniref:Protein CLEC16A n=1 Tax=Menopon gallinae TaxID=328185 RepID=A0AAW2I8T5_9NEOP